jgi:hypothetical protein
MNWKLIFQLSFFGLIMAFGTVSLIPEKIEFVFWLFIFSICAFFIAKVCPGKFFLHGFFLSFFNSAWITLVHIIFYNSYTSHHPDMVAMLGRLPANMALHPRLMQLPIGIISGMFFGLIQGLFAFVASKIVKK